MYQILLTIHVLVCVSLIGLILMQHGKGAQTGAAFGSGASQTVFGSQGSGGFLSNATSTLAAVFFILNLALALIINRSVHPRSDVPMENSAPAQESNQPSREVAPNTDMPATE